MSTMNQEIEIPEYFLCPISLQLMKDPVTATTGITYDRENIEKWLLRNSTCPITKQPLPRNLDLTPNHTLRRLIQAWCTVNSNNGVDRIPTPKSPLNKTHVIKLVKDLATASLLVPTLKKLEALVAENERNRKCFLEAGVARDMLLLILRCFKHGTVVGVQECLKILHLSWCPTAEVKAIANQSHDLIDALTWILSQDHVLLVKTHAVLVLRMIMEITDTNLLERLKPEFFKQVTQVIKESISQQATKAALSILIDICPWGRNRTRIVEAGAIFELIELELTKPETKITELIFCLLGHLCTCADGRARLIGHAGGIALVSKRLLRVSPATDDRAVQILGQVAKYSGSNEVVTEMLRVGGVAKLCMVLQANSESYLKAKARNVLRLHSNVWNDSPCIDVYLLTMHPAR